MFANLFNALDKYKVYEKYIENNLIFFKFLSYSVLRFFS